MVPDPGAATGADRLRPLNLPQPVRVLARRRGSAPTVLVEDGHRHRVEEIQDSWRIDDEWWRAPISRRYYRVVLDDGSLRTLYHDLLDGSWYEQWY